jgi:hypothetical protein
MAEEFIDDIIKEVDGETEVISKDALTQDLESKVVKEGEDKKVAEPSSSDGDEVVVSKEQVAELKENQTPAEIESLAEKLGWNKDFQGPEKVDAATYILKSREIQDTMKEHNKDLKGQIAALQNSIKAIQEHNEKVYKAEVKKLESDLAKLKKEKLEAIELADVAKVTELDDQIEALQKDLSKPKEERTQSVNVNPVYDEWIKENEWYEQDDEMAIFADNVAEQYKGAPLERLYSIVRQKVQEVFPDRFENVSQSSKPVKEQDKPIGPSSPVEKGGGRENKNNFSVNDLTPEQRDIMRQFVKTGVMTEKQYIADIAKMQEG